MSDAPKRIWAWLAYNENHWDGEPPPAGEKFVSHVNEYVLAADYAALEAERDAALARVVEMTLAQAKAYQNGYDAGRAEVAELRKALGNSAMWFAILAAAVGDNIPKLRDECLLQEAAARAALK